MSEWTIFSNHGHVLLYLAREPEARLRDVAQEVGITERAVQKIVRDLQDGGILKVTRHGRRNRYQVNTRKSLRHRLESHRTVGSLVRLIKEGAKPPAQSDQAIEPPPPAPEPPQTETAAEAPVDDSYVEPVADEYTGGYEEPPFDPA